jgi:carbonic anhydrase/acetyltransferase-like protein (isoleucine patch superfamily)
MPSCSLTFPTRQLKRWQFRRGRVARLLSFFLLAINGSASLALAALPFFIAWHSSHMGFILAASVLFPFIFVASFLLLAGWMSRFTQTRIVPGLCARKAWWGQLYRSCWAQVFDVKPVYALCLAVPRLRSWLLKLFGYRGTSLAFTLHPDTWLQDLPVLDIGREARLAPFATIGTTLCVNAHSVLVDAIRIQDGGRIGELSVLAPGCRIGSGADVGEGTAIGLRSWIGPQVSIQSSCGINHGCRLDAGCEIGTRSYLGQRVRIGKGVRVPAGAHIPEGSVIMNQVEMDRIHRSETRMLQDFAASLTLIK